MTSFRRVMTPPRSGQQMETILRLLIITLCHSSYFSPGVIVLPTHQTSSAQDEYPFFQPDR
jgi:hypothetical protein